MDILAGMLAYLAGIGVIFGGLALSLLLFTATPKQPLTPQSPVATAMRFAPGAAAKTRDAQANAKAHRLTFRKERQTRAASAEAA